MLPDFTPSAYPFVLTQLAHFQDLTEHLGQFYAAAAKGTLVLILSAAVLKHNLYREEESGQRRNSVTKHMAYYNKDIRRITLIYGPSSTNDYWGLD